MFDTSSQTAFVQAWLDRMPAELSSGERVALLERALAALWRRANMTLSEVTLGAIADRVIVTTRERCPALAALGVDRSGFRCERLLEPARAASPREVETWTRFVLAEFLTVVGNLTAEVLTPPLHDALAAVGAVADDGEPDRSTNGGEPGGTTGGPMETKP